MAAAFFVGSPAAHAAAAPANTVIGNQASATYLDPNGNSQTATSNIVQTTVQQVGSFTLDNTAAGGASPGPIVNTKAGAAGAVIYAPHVLTNTGNGSDTFSINVSGWANFSKVEVYADTNFDGQPDSSTPFCTATVASPGCSVNPGPSVAGNNGQFGFVVAYTIPSSAAGNVTSYDTGNVTATAGTSALYASSGATVASVRDSVNLTNAAAFNVSKAISQPASGVAPPSGTWPAAVNTGKRSSGTCPVAWSSTLVSGNPNCTYTTYTITYSNTGGAPGKFVMQDVIGSGSTAGLTYVTGSTVWSNQSGTALAETAGSTANTNVGVDFANSSGTLTFVDSSLPVNTTRSLTFVVLVNSNASVGTANTVNTVAYNPTNAGSGVTANNPGPISGGSNGSPFTVLGTYSISLGNASPTSASAAKDSTPGTPNGTASDQQTLPFAVAGHAASFTHTIYNLGNTTDTVNLSIVQGTTPFPSGTTYQFYAIDGSTPLADTNNDGTVDTGPIAAGGSIQIIVKATVPSTTPINASANYMLNVKGVSVGDSTQLDASADTITAISGPAVDLTNTNTGSNNALSGDLGPGPSAQPTVSPTAAAGSWTTISLFVKNNDSLANSYNLSASATTNFPGSLPAGWIVKFVQGAAPTNCAAATSVTTTTSVPTITQVEYTACVYVPANQVVGVQALYFQAKATSAASNTTFPADTIYDAVNVAAAASTFSATFTPNNTGTIAPGGSGAYGHALTATGTGTCRPTALSATLPSSATNAGWTVALYIDVNGNGLLDSNDQLYTNSTTLSNIPTGGALNVLVKVFAPAGASAGQTATATVSATFAAGSDNCGTPSATDTVTVVTGQVSLVISQVKVGACTQVNNTSSAVSGLTGQVITAKPGECVLYQVVATNSGTAPVTNLKLVNTVPTYTTLAAPGVQPTVNCLSTGISPAFSNTDATGLTSTASTSVSCGNASNTVQPGGTATLTYMIKVNQ